VSTIGAPERVGATVTIAVEQSVLRDQTLGELSPAQVSGSGSGRAQRLVSGWSSNTGFSAQTNLAFRDVAYLTAGARLERIGQTFGSSQFETLPMLGGALVRDFDGATVKFRGAYGKGIRAPRSTMHVATREPRRTIRNSNLQPEEQSGTEAGVDMMVGRRLGMHVTRFDQRASGLIQTVTIADTTAVIIGVNKVSYWHQLQNVGEITNRGWEAQASVALGSIGLSSAATLVDSRVRRLASGYTGDLRPGDRMLAVPARTVSGTASWTRRGLHVSSTVSRASDWINYDRLRIAECMISGCVDSRKMSGAKLREFWIRYPGATRLRGAMSYDLRKGLSVNVTGENLLNHQRGEPDSITIVPGRTVMVGLKARF
jgi:iron complex outermembrane receptor protein